MDINRTGKMDLNGSIEREYTRLQFIKDIERNVCKVANSENLKNSTNSKGGNVSKSIYELKNILERFLIRLANADSEYRADPIFINLSDDHEIYKKLLSELKEKKIKKCIVIKNIIKKYIYDFLLLNISGKDKVYKNNKGEFIYKNFKKFLPPNRIRILSETAKYNNVPANAINESITTMLIRYECLMPRGQQWGIPFEWYKNIQEKYGICIELFASPINSQIALVYDYLSIEELSGLKFASIFPDTDTIFGSVGNVIGHYKNTEKMSKILCGDGKIIVANPPYVEELMNKLVKIIHYWMSKFKITIILNVPEWKDAEYYLESQGSTYLVYEKTLMPNTYYYENSSSKSIQAIDAKFKTHLFILSNTGNANTWDDSILDGYLKSTF